MREGCLRVNVYMADDSCFVNIPVFIVFVSFREYSLIEGNYSYSLDFHIKLVFFMFTKGFKYLIYLSRYLLGLFGVLSPGFQE